MENELRINDKKNRTQFCVHKYFMNHRVRTTSMKKLVTRKLYYLYFISILVTGICYSENIGVYVLVSSCFFFFVRRRLLLLYRNLLFLLLLLALLYLTNLIVYILFALPLINYLSTSRFRLIDWHAQEKKKIHFRISKQDKQFIDRERVRERERGGKRVANAVFKISFIYCNYTNIHWLLWKFSSLISKWTFLKNKTKHRRKYVCVLQGNLRTF